MVSWIDFGKHMGLTKPGLVKLSLRPTVDVNTAIVYMYVVYKIVL